MRKISVLATAFSIAAWSMEASSAATSSSTTSDVVVAAVKVASVPTATAYTNQDWDALRKAFPKQQFEDNGDAKVARVASLSDGGLTVSAKGARTMILSVEVSGFSREASAPILGALRKLKAKPLRCDSEEPVSSYERYYLIEVAGYKPIKAKYEFSAGSAGGSEWLILDSSVEIPKTGSDALGGKWGDKCN